MPILMPLIAMPTRLRATRLQTLALGITAVGFLHAEPTWSAAPLGPRVESATWITHRLHALGPRGRVLAERMAAGLSRVNSHSATAPRCDRDYAHVNLGHLGGEFAIGTAINESGQVAGTSVTAEGIEHAFVWKNGIMTDLGSLGSNTVAQAINQRGQIAGISLPVDASDYHAFLWQDGVMIDLGPSDAEVVALNDRGQVIGNLPTLYPRRGFFWEDGVRSDVGTLGGAEAYVIDINNRGQVTGFSTTASGRVHAFVWQDGVMTDVGTIGGDFSMGIAINESGQIVGNTGGEALERGFLWHHGVMTDLGTNTFPSLLNERGQVAGVYQTADELHGFSWEGGVLTDLGNVVPLAMNERGEIVGFMEGADGLSHAFVWRDGCLTDLGPSWVSDINGHGSIVGNGGDAITGSSHQLWSPSPSRFAAGDTRLPGPATLGLSDPSSSAGQPGVRVSTRRGAVELRFESTEDGTATIVDIQGRVVQQWDRIPAGRTQIVWDGTAHDGAPARSGIYFLRVRTGIRQHSSKFVLVR